MQARLFHRAALAFVLAVAAPAAFAGGGGHGGGPVFRGGGGFHGGFGGFHGAGGARPGGFRGLPPVSGVIHERSGARPYYSAYGHTDTAARFGGFGRMGGAAYGHTGTGLSYRGGYRPFAGGYGHYGTSLRYGAAARLGAGRGVRRYGYGFGGGFGGFGGGFGLGAGTYGAPGIYGDAGVYGGQGTYGDSGTYGGQGTYGGAGTTATQSVYGTGGGVAYRSETPLAARFAEPPLGPSPYAPYSPDDRYAYAASADVRTGPRVLNPFRASRGDCDCGPRAQPVIYRYGIGTAY